MTSIYSSFDNELTPYKFETAPFPLTREHLADNTHGKYIFEPETDLQQKGVAEQGEVLESVEESELGGNCFETTDPDLILKARQLTAEVYLRRKFITADQLDENGAIAAEFDPQINHSRYFVKTTPDKNEVIATVRVIDYDKSKGDKSFPVLDHKDTLDQESASKIYDYGLENVKEISALARNNKLDKSGDAALELYKKVFFSANFSDSSPDTMFIMALNPVLYKHFSLLFDGAIKRTGPDLPYPGQVAIPAMIPIREAMKHVIELSKDKRNPYRGVQKLVTDYFLHDLKAPDLDESVAKVLQECKYDDLLKAIKSPDVVRGGLSAAELTKKLVPAVGVGRLHEKTKKYMPEIAGSAALAGYTAVRTVVVAAGVDPVADTDWRVFLGVELATTPPYTWGIGDLIRGSLKDNYSKVRRGVASAAVGSAFIAPYAYLAANGAAENLQSAAAGGTVLAAGLYFLSAKLKTIVKNRRASKELEQSAPQERSNN